MNPHPSKFFLRLLLWIGRRILALRYRIRVTGFDEVRARGQSGLIFLPNHPALMDPVIVTTLLYTGFAPRSVADEVQVNRPIIGPLARMLGARIIPNLDRRGTSGVEWMRKAFAETIDGLKAGENLLIYPAGHLKHRRVEEIGAASGVKDILDAVPNLRVVLVRQNGLWGSRFSFAFGGRMPAVGGVLVRGVLYLLGNLVFFMPRRRVTVEFVEQPDFPRGADRLTINRYLEDFYNAVASPNTYVPYGFWDRGGVRELPDPEELHVAGDPATVPEATRELVVQQLTAMTGRTGAKLSDRLGADLGLDSLATAELVLWIEQEFRVTAGSPENLRTVGDVVLAAGGQAMATAAKLKRVSKRWFQPREPGKLVLVPEGDTVLGAFLGQAARGPDRIAIADQTSGEKSYRDIITAMIALKPIIEEIPGEHLGIMFPASAGSVILYMAAVAAGKTPVMVNWTTGSRNVAHALDLLGVRTVITARALLVKLDAMGVDLGALRDRFLAVEDLAPRMTLARKVSALAQSYLSWRSLRSARPAEHAVILFTSGSENLPKAVPLTHQNILTNIRDVIRIIPVYETDVLIGMLPPFHSFGICITMILPFVLGVRAVYHPNPTEPAMLARLIEAYKVTLLVGTPTFLSGIVSVAEPGQLASLRYAVTGAERCPMSLFDALEARCPQLTVIEGYGITECSPIVSGNRYSAPIRGSVGYLLPTVEGAVVDVETGSARVATGETGILLVRGPSIFSGYLHFTGESPFVSFDGKSWYRTGDLVRQQEDGALFFEGRLKRFVKLGGEMISLPAIESVLVSVYGADDEDGPRLAVEALGDPDNPDIVVFSRIEMDRNRVNEQLRERGMSPLYHVRQVIPVDSIPVLGTGKTDYRQLKERHVI
jgi:acyl-CoA synthetase (AMP-forming)/AMP-acid ligase II/acyl carrier protein